jgi:protein-S-isoprenylcysteine O-methyltransferase Ste14
MGAVLIAATAMTLAASIPLIARVKREYEDGGVLSEATVAAVWVLYSAVVAAVVLAAIFGVWEIGLPTEAAVPVGVALVVLGLILAAAGLASMASLRRMSGMQPDRLITSGAFRFSRNPQNVGLGTALVGVAIIGDSGLALLAAAGFWGIFYAYVGYEEEHLARIFGSEYERYRLRAPRFLGWPKSGDRQASPG